MDAKYSITRAQRVRSLLQTPTQMFTQQCRPPNLQTAKNKSLRMSFYKELPGFTLKNYVFQSLIGKGQYGKVYKATKKRDNSLVAIKVYEKCFLTPIRKSNIAREINILQRLNHPNIIKIIEVVDTPRSINIVLEYGGEVSLKRHPIIKEDEAKRIIKQIISAVHYINSQQIIHRDLKLENILQYEGQIKIIDFGFSTISDGNLQKIFCGTPNYMAPELVSKVVSYSFEVDIWACGVILFHLLSQSFPFKGSNEQDLYLNIKLCKYELLPNEQANHFLRRLFNLNPKKRIKPFDALLDPYLDIQLNY